MVSRVHYGGFTLLDLLMVVAIATIVMLIGVPSLQTITQNARIVTTSNEVLRALHLARSEAVKRATFVTICRSMDQQQCSTDNNREWEHGWIIFVDPERSGKVDQDAEVIRVSGSVTSGVTVRSGGNYAQYLSFGALGGPRGNTGLPNDTFRVCDDRGGSHARAVVVNIVGRARVTDGQGQTITCPNA